MKCTVQSGGMGSNLGSVKLGIFSELFPVCFEGVPKKNSEKHTGSPNITTRRLSYVASSYAAMPMVAGSPPVLVIA